MTNGGFSVSALLKWGLSLLTGISMGCVILVSSAWRCCAEITNMRYLWGCDQEEGRLSASKPHPIVLCHADHMITSCNQFQLATTRCSTDHNGAAMLDHGGSHVGQLRRQGVWELSIGLVEGGGSGKHNCDYCDLFERKTTAPLCSRRVWSGVSQPCVQFCNNNRNHESKQNRNLQFYVVLQVCSTWPRLYPRVSCMAFEWQVGGTSHNDNDNNDQDNEARPKTSTLS